MHITTLKFCETGLFGMDALTNALAGSTYSLDPKINVIIGPNSSGKSSILNMIRSSMTQVMTDDHVEQYDRLFLGESSPQVYCEPGLSPDWPADQKNPASDALPLLWIPAQRSPFHPPKQWEKTEDLSHEQSLLNHLSPEALISAALDTRDGIFRSHYIELARRRLTEEMPDSYDKATAEQVSAYARFADAFSAGVLCATEICNDVLEPPKLLDVGEAQFYDPGTTGLHNIYRTMEPVEQFPQAGEDPEPTRAIRSVNQLSAGTSTVLGWTITLAFALARHNEWQDGWQQQPATLLFDEIENQLHPGWQQRLIPAFSEHFPGVQLIATTHSPFMAINRDSGQVHRLRRHQDGTVSMDTFGNHTYGWSAEQVVHDLMEVNTNYSDKVAGAAAELARLTASPDPSNEARLAELRSVINRDLLSRTGTHVIGPNQSPN